MTGATQSSFRGSPLGGRFGWKWFLTLPVLAALAVCLITWTFNDEYASTAKILPPSIFSAPARVLIFPGDSLNERLAEQLSIRYQSDMALTALKSTPVLDDLIRTLKLPNPRARSNTALRDGLLDASRLSSSRDGVISIMVTDENPQQAARIANGYVEALERYVNEFTAATAHKRAAVLEQQLRVARDRLAVAEKAFSQSQVRTGIIKSDGESSSTVNNLADLRQRLAVRESQMTAMSAYSASGNPGYRRVEAEVRGLRAQIDRIVGRTDSTRDAPGAAVVPADEAVEYQRTRREAKTLEDIVDSLRKQLAQAQFEEVAQVSGVQVIERAMPAEHRSGPNRLVISLIAGLGVLLALTLWASFTAFWWRPGSRDQPSGA